MFKFDARDLGWMLLILDAVAIILVVAGLATWPGGSHWSDEKIRAAIFIDYGFIMSGVLFIGGIVVWLANPPDKRNWPLYVGTWVAMLAAFAGFLMRPIT